jgi:alpha-beta hydrolase superfamily lysophospholipase
MGIRALIFVAIAIVAVVVFAQFVRRTGMFFPDRYPTGQWDIHAWPVTPADHVFASADGVKLHGWWFRATDPAAPVLIWYHGNAGNITNRADTASELARRGISVFVFDYRGFGKSEGGVSESKTYADSLAAHDYVRQHTGSAVILYGESLGGAFAAYVAKERRSARAVIMENTFPSLLALGNALYRPLPLGWTAPFAMRTAGWLNEAGAPVLVLHGKRDAVIPYRLGRQLYDELRVPKEMLISESAGHCEIPVVEAERYYETVTRFVARGPLSAP